MIKIISNVLTTQDCFSLYQGLSSANIWSLHRKSSGNNLGGSFPGVNFIENNEVVFNNQDWIGYFNCLFDRINQKLLEQHNFNLNRKIQRINLNAQNDNHYTEFHSDTQEDTYRSQWYSPDALWNEERR